jgi:hypothetical protein
LPPLQAEHPKWTQQQIAEAVGCSQQYVAKATTENSHSEVLVVPDHILSHTGKADFRKLSKELREEVAAKKVSLNAAAIRAGIRKASSGAGRHRKRKGKK